MATGAAASDVVASVLRLTAAYRLRSVHVDVTFSALTVSYHRGPQARPTHDDPRRPGPEPGPAGARAWTTRVMV